MKGGKVVFNISVSLDGFVAGTGHKVDRIFRWYFSGDTGLPFSPPGQEFKVSSASAAFLMEQWSRVGAIVTGRKTFELAGAWGGHPPLGVPHFVLTHTIPEEWVREGSPFTFVTDGIESAVAQARQVAGEKDVAIGTPSTMQQCLKAGLLDELALDLVPLLLGEGIRLFEHLGIEPVDLEQINVIEGTGVTHLRYALVK